MFVSHVFDGSKVTTALISLSLPVARFWVKRRAEKQTALSLPSVSARRWPSSIR